jgi:formamidopyrimidine-DNA glycosylase
MPELPEVETMRRGVASIAGCTIRDCRKHRSRLQSIEITPDFRSFRRPALGRTIAAVGRLGKRIVLELDSHDRIIIEPRMSGSVFLGDCPNFRASENGTVPFEARRLRDRTHLRLIFDLVKPAKQLLFWDQRGLGVVRLVSPAEFDSRYGPDKIGPDALQISAAQLRDRLKSSGRAVKVALLDQKALAGIGNIYASEILHLVRIHPATPCNRLTPRQWTKLHAAMGVVLHEALLHQGSTLADNVYTTPEGAPGEYAFRVYQRHGEPCLQCGKATIVRIVQAQRSTFFCPACQTTYRPRRPRAGGAHD